MTTYRQSEHVVEGRRLGRHVNHDPRSLRYQVEPDGAGPVPASWGRVVPIFDQGKVGSCTGNALVGALATAPFYNTEAPKKLTFDEKMALSIYSDAESIDGNGAYPPNDYGSSGLSVAKVALSRGLIAGYQHITSIDAAYAAIQLGPFIVGSDWYTSFDSPVNGLVEIARGATVRGGHEYECTGFDGTEWIFANSWGTSFGNNGFFSYSTKTFAALLANQGDATSFVPLGTPAPTPTPVADGTDAALVAAGNSWEPGVMSRLTKSGKFKVAFDNWKRAKGY